MTHPRNRPTQEVALRQICPLSRFNAHPKRNYAPASAPINTADRLLHADVASFSPVPNDVTTLTTPVGSFHLARVRASIDVGGGHQHPCPLWRSLHWVRMFLCDKELASNAAKMATTRSEVALKMNVPAEVQQAHPHLLATLSAMEAAMQAAVEGKTFAFVRQLQTSTGEAKTFQAVLQTLGFSLPDYGHMAMVLPTSSLV